MEDNLQEISSEFSFCAAHRLIHMDRCASLHGHTWRGTVAVVGRVHPLHGVVLDFHDLRAVLREILPDHKTILSRKDPLIDVLRPYAVIDAVDGEPTAENLAAILAARIDRALADRGVRVIRLVLDEGRGAAATWTPEPPALPAP